MAPRKKPQPAPESEPKVMVFETFKEIGSYEIRTLKDDAPYCFNGIVAVRRYRVTIEEIEEPNEVIQERLQKLWDKSKNHHDWGHLQAVARRYGLDLHY